VGISTNSQVKSESKPGKHKVDNGEGYKGLFLVIRKGGQKSWMYRYQLNKSRIDMGLGRYPEVSLKEARDKHIDASRQVQNREHPSGPQAVQKIPTFREAADEYINNNRSGWKNGKHAQQWENTLATYAHPFIGDMPVDQIKTSHLKDVLLAPCSDDDDTPFWLAKQETASRVRTRIKLVLHAGLGSCNLPRSENPAKLENIVDDLPKITNANRARVNHHAAIPYKELPTLMAELVKRDCTSARALQFTILTAARTDETLATTWDEIDGNAWTVPEERYKTHKMHKVPLSTAAQEILKIQPRIDEYVFSNAGRPMSNMAMLTLLQRRMDRPGITVHGMRSAFKDWSEDTLKYPHKVSEAALGHKGKNDPNRGAYNRTTFFDRRVDLMQDWADYLYGMK